jgi:hypothetical protein
MIDLLFITVQSGTLTVHKRRAKGTFTAMNLRGFGV